MVDVRPSLTEQTAAAAKSQDKSDLDPFNSARLGNAATAQKPAAGTGATPAKPAGGNNAGDFLKIPVPTLWNPPKQGLYTRGVGGKTYFKLAVANRGRDTGRYGYDHNNAVLFEMAPARRSFFEKQGQPVPGVGAGMDLMTKANIAKLNVPGARPLYQHMGIAEERIEFVGAFIGYDEYVSHGGKPTFDTDFPDYQNAWEKSQRLAYAVRAGKEMGVFIGWEDESDNPDVGNASLSGIDHHIRFDNEHIFRGYIHSIVRTYATAHRVYYRVSMIVTNSDDMLNGKSAYGKPVPLPTVLATLAEIVPQQGAAPAATTPPDEVASAPVEPAAPTAAPTVKPQGTYAQPANPNAVLSRDTALSNLVLMQDFSLEDEIKNLSALVPAGLRSDMERRAIYADRLAEQAGRLNLTPKDVAAKQASLEKQRQYINSRVFLPPRDKAVLLRVLEKEQAVYDAVVAFDFKPIPMPNTPPEAEKPAATPTPKPAVSPPAAKPSPPQPTPKPVPPENNNYVPKLERVVVPNFAKQGDLTQYEKRLVEFNEWLNKHPGKVYPVETISSFKDGYEFLSKQAAQATVDALNKKLFTAHQARTTAQRISAYTEEWRKLVERNNRRMAQQRSGNR